MKRISIHAVPPRKVRYHHILEDLQVIFEQGDDHERDFKIIHEKLAKRYGLSKEALLLQGVRRAYRQIVEGV